MDAKDKEKLRLYCLGTGVVAIFLGWLYISSVWSDPIGQEFLCFYGPILNCSLFLSIWTLALSGVSYLVKPDPQIFNLLAPATTFSTIVILFILARHPLETYRAKQLLETFTPLIDAIEQYEQDNGHAPDDLHDLVPDYIDRVPTKPTTGNFDYGYDPLDYEYSNDLAVHGWYDNTWAISLRIPTPPLDYGQVLYLPTQNYPNDAILYGDWAWLGENSCWGEYRDRCP